MEQEFSFKDILLYSLKRWFIILLAAVITAACFLLYFVFQDPQGMPVETYMVELRFCSFETYAENQSGIDQSAALPGNSLLDIYNSTANMAIKDMGSLSARNIFFADEKVKENFKTLYFTKKQLEKMTQEPSFSGRFLEDFSFTETGENKSLQLFYKGALNTDEKRAAAKTILDLYAESAKSFAYSRNPSLSSFKEPGAISNIPAAQTFLSEGDVKNIAGYLSQTVIGLVVGIILGVVLIAVIYFIDPRVKSFLQIKPLCGILLAKTDDESVLFGAVTKTWSLLRENKSLLVLSPVYDEFTKRFSFLAASAAFETCGKALLIKQGEKPSMLSYFKGKNVKDCVQKDSKGFDVLEYGENDWVHFIPGKDRFKQLYENYDKIIISAEDNGTGLFEAVSFVADRTVLIIDQKKVKFSSLLTSLETVYKEENKIVGTYIHNII